MSRTARSAVVSCRDFRADLAPRRRAGVSLIELLMVLAIVAILTASAGSLIGSGLEAGRALSARAELLGSFIAALNKSTITGTRTVLCPAHGDVCLDSVEWSGGWMVFVDRDGNRERDEGEPVVARQGELGGQVRLRSTEGRKRIVFQGSGSNAGSNVTFTLCDGRGPNKAQSLILNNRGRLRVDTPTPKAIAATCPE